MIKLLTALEAVDGTTNFITYTEDGKGITVETTGTPRGQEHHHIIMNWQSEADYIYLRWAIYLLGLDKYIEIEHNDGELIIRYYKED